MRKGLFECIDRILNYHDHLKVYIQLDVYDHTNGEFGSRAAIDSQKLRSPTSWSMHFRGSTSELKSLLFGSLALLLMLQDVREIGGLLSR